MEPSRQAIAAARDLRYTEEDMKPDEQVALIDNHFPGYEELLNACENIADNTEVLLRTQTMSPQVRHHLENCVLFAQAALEAVAQTAPTGERGGGET